MSNDAVISSPAATGGGGTIYEQHVGAYWLALLLVEGCPPIFLDTIVRKVSFQVEHLGWHTDDALVTCETTAGNRRRIACQVKKAFSVGAEDTDFRSTITDAWRDFTGTTFTSDDAFAIVTLRGTNIVLRDLATLLDTARASSTAADFAHRMTAAGFISSDVRRHRTVIEKILDAHEGSSVDRERIWRFLRHVCVLPFDLGTQTAQTEAQIRTILARTVTATEPVSAAAATWNELFRAASAGIPAAQEFERTDLPAAALDRHACVRPDDRRILSSLAKHTDVVLAAVETKIGGLVHLPRAQVVTEVMGHLERSNVLLVTGSAGSGKSGIAKEVAAKLGTSEFVFAFRAEEFARPHLDAALSAIGLSATAADFAAVLGAQPRKTLIIESGERVLETTTRDAFTDLLRFVRDDPSWRLIITCREYSVDLLRVAFLEPQNVPSASVAVPPLSDSEIATVAADVPIVARLLRSARMKTLLRNAYVLQMAVRIPWEENEPLPETERDFRRRFWKQFVRSDDRRDGGMPQRRADAFREICVRRAKALTLFAPVSGIDADALATLERDSLVVLKPGAPAAAPAHDVLEDWGVLEWIATTYDEAAGNLHLFAEALGGAPAIRRTYRTWIAEFLVTDSANADALFSATLTAKDLPQHFRDDTIVAFLRSPRAPELLRRHARTLLAGEKELFRRVLHLLRVGCVRLPAWASQIGASNLFQPEGASWECVLGLVREHIDLFVDGRDRLLLLGFVEDWARSVTPQIPRPPGHEAAVAITLWLIPYYEGYGAQKVLERVVKVLVKIPASDAKGFERVLRGGEDERNDPAAENLRELVYDGIEGYAAARDLPDILVSVGNEYYLANNDEDDDPYHSSLDIDGFFGMQESHGSHLPPSVYRGPFRALLREHPKTGRDFVIGLLNHAGVWYGERRGRGHDLEDAWQIELTFADGTKKSQWANERLWNVYRGTTVTPYPLQSAAMALEAWFFEVAEEDETLLDALLLQTLRMSESVALTAVVASVAVRYPRACGETLLVLLSSPDCVQIDRVRMVRDQTGSAYPQLPQSDAMNTFFAKERADSDALPQRKRDIEMAIVQLQGGPIAERVHASLDAHAAALPPVEEQTEEDRTWRFALHRMDLRKYRVASDEEVPLDAAPEVADGQKYLVLMPQEPEPDLKAVMEESAEKHAQVSARLGNLLWGVKIFERATDVQYEPAEWRMRLTSIRTSAQSQSDREEMFLGDAATPIAAVCIRDHWSEISEEEQTWCAERVYTAVRASSGAKMPGVLGGTKQAATVIPLLVDRTAHSTGAVEALAVALTHEDSEVRLAAAQAAGEVLWTAHHEVNVRAMAGLRAEASALDDAFGFRGKRGYLPPDEVQKVRATSAEKARQIIVGSDDVPTAEDLPTDAATGWFAAEAALEITHIALGAPNEATSLAVFQEGASTLVAWWDADRSNRGSSRDRHSFETEYALEQALAEALFRVDDAHVAAIIAPLLAAVESHPGKVDSIVENLTFREDRQPATQRYWMLWRMFAEHVSLASWLPKIDSEHSAAKAFFTAVFLASNWKDTTRDWRSLAGHSDEVHGLFERLPLSKTSLHRYLLFLYHIGEQSLPHAFARLHEKLRDANVPELLAELDSAFVLESLLLRYVYSKPLELKLQHDLRAAVLFLLDALVDTGSSSAFRMRDDFVTPINAPQ